VNDWHDHPVTVTWRHCLPPCDFSPLFQNELKRSLGQKHHPLVLMLDSVLSKAVYKQFNLIFDTICFVSVLFCGLFYHLKFCRRPFTATLVSSEKKPLWQKIRTGKSGIEKRALEEKERMKDKGQCRVNGRQ